MPQRSMKDDRGAGSTSGLRDGEADGAGRQMTNGSGQKGRKRAPALQVVCLGDSGGPSEENVTAFLVRSVASEWARGSVLAVDAGSHLAPITRIVERDFPIARRRVEEEEAREREAEAERVREEEQTWDANGLKTPGLSKDMARTSLSPAPEWEHDDMLSDEESPKPTPTTLISGPFAGLKLPHASARANALHLLQVYISTYLITHPHMDHISGFTINTAAFHATSKPKTLAALPGTVDAMKRHVFNDVIWPNLSDEDGGVGFVTFQRLKEGGDPMLGEGEGRGYIDVCDGLGVKAFAVSHGTCTKSPPSHTHRGSAVAANNNGASFSGDALPDPAPGMSRSLSLSQHQASQFSAPGTPGPTPRLSFYAPLPSPRLPPQTTDSQCVVDSTAYFLRDSSTGREVLFFGDVEPDSISLFPRNHVIWAEAARKIANHCLTGVFIECSYDDAQADSYLFGHLAPRHLIAELQTLAALTRDARIARAEAQQAARKRKRSGDVARVAAGESERKRSRSLASRVHELKEERRRSETETGAGASGEIEGVVGSAPPSPAAGHMYLPGSEADGSLPDTPMSPLSTAHPAPSTTTNPSTSAPQAQQTWDRPLQGVRIVVIHVKDTFKDGPHVRDRILAQLRGHEEVLEGEGRGLGCEFRVCGSGRDYWF